MPAAESENINGAHDVAKAKNHDEDEFVPDETENEEEEDVGEHN